MVCIFVTPNAQAERPAPRRTALACCWAERLQHSALSSPGQAPEYPTVLVHEAVDDRQFVVEGVAINTVFRSEAAEPPDSFDVLDRDDGIIARVRDGPDVLRLSYSPLAEEPFGRLLELHDVDGVALGML